MFFDLFKDPLPVGSVAPQFQLPDDAGNLVSLEALRGQNVVLVFYPADDTHVCTKQLCDFRDNWGLASSKNTKVFGVNPASAESHAKFRERHEYPFPILVDKGQRMGADYHCKGIVPRRTVYLIGPDGTIRFAKRGVPSPKEVLATAA
jgi:peroxiredoxin Q/BCP